MRCKMCEVPGAYVCLADIIGVRVGVLGEVVRAKGGCDPLFFCCAGGLVWCSHFAQGYFSRSLDGLYSG